MLKNKKLQLCFLLILLTITAVRETGLVDYNCCRSTLKSQTNARWNSSVAKMNSVQEFNKTWKEAITSNCNFGGELKNYPVNVFYKSFKFGDSTKCHSLKIEITDLSPGVIWTPLYKSTDFTATAHCNDGVTLYKRIDGKIFCNFYSIRANISVSGHITVYGLSSYRNTKQLIIDQIEKQIYQETKGHFGNL